MAKDVITRFKLETTAYDSKLRDASKGMAEFAKTATAAGKEFDKYTKESVEAARALGNIAPSANNAKDKVKELVTAYNELFKAYDALTKEQQQSDFGKAMAESLGKLKTQIAAAKQELYGMGDAMKDATKGFLSGDKLSGMLQVFGGNVMTKAAGMAAQFGTELVSCVQQGVELARQGEGIRVAFERLGRGDILQGLRDATHGTVTDLELMKAAVKFNDFKLPLDQLGTLLAFAQQKAKDTGQSVDYMVDSIVTGLGRKSLMILDNLGLSAAQVKERMAETGDMTTAVADIIREEMSKSGDYIETAAERATQADVQLQNAMENLGRTLLPLQEQGESMWKSLETGAINLLNEGLTPMVPKVIELKNEISELYDTISGSSVFSGLVDWMETGIDTASVFIPKLRLIRKLLDFGNGNAAGAGAEIGGIIANIPDQTINEIPEVEVIGHKSTHTTTGRSGGRSSQPSYMEGSISEQQALVSALNKKWQDAAGTVKNDYLTQLVAAESVLAKMKESDALDKWDAGYQMRKGSINIDMSSITGADNTALSSWYSQAKDQQFMGLTKEGQKALSNQQKQYEKQQKKKGEDKSFVDVADQMVGGINNMVGSLEQMGIELPEGFKGVINGISGVIGVLNSIVMIVNAIQAMQEVGTFLGIFANGGIVPHAANGYYVPGNSHSGDNTMIMANAGELVLSRSQQGNLASQLEGSGMQNMQLDAVLSGEQIRLVLNNNGRRTGRGEFVQSTRRR